MQNAAELGSFPETLGAVLIMNIAVEWSEFLKFAQVPNNFIGLKSWNAKLWQGLNKTTAEPHGPQSTGNSSFLGDVVGLL